MAKSEEELLLEEINRIINGAEEPEEAVRDDDRIRDALAGEIERRDEMQDAAPVEPEDTGDGMVFASIPGEEPEEAQEPEEPEKGKRRFRWTTLALIVGILLLVYAIGNFAYLFWNYYKSNSLYEDLNNSFVTTLTDYVPATESALGTETGTDTEPEAAEYVGPWYEMVQVDIAGLKAVNPDVVGWLYQENGSISYPIMYSGDNDTYLHAALDKSYAYAGSIFMEGQSNPDFNDSYTIIYGHNMRNLSMFGSLKYYHQSGYYEEHQYFQIFTEDGIYRYHVFAYDIVDCNDEQIYSVPYGDDEEFAALLKRLYSKSEKDTGVEATTADKVIMLSTCSTGDNRFVVHAVLEDVYLYADADGDTEAEAGTEAVE